MTDGKGVEQSGIRLCVNYVISAVGLHSVDDEYVFFVKNGNQLIGKMVPVPTDQAVAVLAEFKRRHPETPVICAHNDVIVNESVIGYIVDTIHYPQ